MWVTLAARFPHDPAIQALPPNAQLLLLGSVIYCSEHATDFIPEADIAGLWPSIPRPSYAIKALEKSNFWIRGTMNSSSWRTAEHPIGTVQGDPVELKGVFLREAHRLTPSNVQKLDALLKNREKCRTWRNNGNDSNLHRKTGTSHRADEPGSSVRQRTWFVTPKNGDGCTKVSHARARAHPDPDSGSGLLPEYSKTRTPSEDHPSGGSEAALGVNPSKTPTQQIWDFYEATFEVEEGTKPDRQKHYFIHLTRLLKRFTTDEILLRLKHYFTAPPYSLRDGSRDFGRFLKCFDLLARPSGGTSVDELHRLSARERRLEEARQRRELGLPQPRPSDQPNEVTLDDLSVRRGCVPGDPARGIP